MNFTREPIIETIITPRDGCRLMVRKSKQGSEEEFSVDAVEIVSFGPVHFYRSMEKPRPFLIPVGDYEIIEVKENRITLKNNQLPERTIKIGGGKEGSLRREPIEEEDSVDSMKSFLSNGESPTEETAPFNSSPNSGSGAAGKKQERRRHRRRGSANRKDPSPQPSSSLELSSVENPSEKNKDAAPPLPFTHLIPPPTTLISDTLHRYKGLQEPKNEIDNLQIPESKEEVLSDLH